MVTSKKTTAFLRELLKNEDPLLNEIQKDSRKGWVPVLPPESANFLSLLVKMSNAKKILEVGTSVGYSAITFCKAMGPEGRVNTVEIDEETINRARKNFVRAGVQDQVTIFPGDVKEILPYMEGSYDMIFMDGPKAHYQTCIPYFLDLLKEGGLLICDNVLFRGMISGDRKVRKRKITIINRMRRFLHYISKHPCLDTSVIPLGDGISISIKRKEKKE